MDQLNMEKLKVYDLEEIVAIIVFYSRVQNTNYESSFHKNRIKTLVELVEWLRKYVNIKEFFKTKDLDHNNAKRLWKKGKQDLQKKEKGKTPRKDKLKEG